MQKAFSFSYTDQFHIPHHCAGACIIEKDRDGYPKGITDVTAMIDGHEMCVTPELKAEIESLVITGCHAYKAPVNRRESNAVEVPFTALIGEASEMEGTLVTVFEEVEL